MNKHWLHKETKKWNWRRKRTKPFAFYRNYNNEKVERKSTMDKFWELLANSTIFQGIITMLLLATTCYLWITGQVVPDNLWTANTFVLAFFFGAKVQNQVQRRVK